MFIILWIMEIFLYAENKLPWQGSSALHLLSHCFKQAAQNGVGALASRVICRIKVSLTYQMSSPASPVYFHVNHDM